MEKNAAAPEKSVSFPRLSSKKNILFSSPITPRRYETIDEDAPSESQDPDQDPNSSNQTATELNLSEVLEEVDRFLDSFSEAKENGNSDPTEALEVPDSVESLSKTVESMINKYGRSLARFGENEDEDESFIDAVIRISRISTMLDDFSSSSKTGTALNRTSTVLQRAMAQLDEEFRNLLLLDQQDANGAKSDYNPEQSFSSKITSKLSSFNSNSSGSNHGSVRGQQPQPEPDRLVEFPSFSEESISTMNKIATTMIAAGYENECCMVYSISRRNAFKSALNNIGYESISIDEVQRMPWESLQGEIGTWISVVKLCSSVLFSGERKLCDAVFSGHKSLSESLFCNLARAVAIQLFNFADAVVLTKRSPEKLFTMLDMYETLRDLVPAIRDSYPEDIGRELISEAEAARNRLGEVAVSILCDLENSIKSDNGKTPVPSGSVHPLTRYVMNYLEYTCEYKDSLEQVFVEFEKTHGTPGTTSSPFQMQLLTVMDMLDSNLDMKSRLYRDPALRFIFLMNNGRYIMQKVKGSTEIHQLMGDTWCRKRSTDLRGYHKNYQRETWGKVLQCVNHEGLQVSGKVSKTVIKERFKCFNTLFDEIHKTQSTWVVSDEQLQSELRVSVSAVVIPAYRSFWGRFKQYLEGTKQAEKYIKYQPEDIENLIDDLFDGGNSSMMRRRT
ncbi:exocyst complex component EXO70B1 [Prunus avium]|uniref:Exocyst subunit Exo70 family protein n=1 Tax=Prunus avium TaxID=42229 RepID=A0A6P5SDF8_PRUAV|nr:exocyst complex component EXO70B1 [Prunus avium]